MVRQTLPREAERHGRLEPDAASGKGARRGGALVPSASVTARVTGAG